MSNGSEIDMRELTGGPYEILSVDGGLSRHHRPVHRSTTSRMQPALMTVYEVSSAQHLDHCHRDDQAPELRTISCATSSTIDDF